MCISHPRRILLASALFLTPAAPLLAQDINSPIVPTTPTPGQTTPNTATSRTPNRQGDPDSTPGPGSTAQEMQDKKFLRDFAQGGLAEIKLGQLASTRAGSDDVKVFGAKMVADHTQMVKDLAPVADELGIRLPKDLTKSDQADYDRLSQLSGDDFDKAYLTAMLEDHRKDLRALRQESMATQDTALHAAIDKSFPEVRDHMGMAVKLAKEKGIAPPPPPHNAGATQSLQPQRQ